MGCLWRKTECKQVMQSTYGLLTDQSQKVGNKTHRRTQKLIMFSEISKHQNTLSARSLHCQTNCRGAFLSTIQYFLQTSHFYVWGRAGTCSKKATLLSVETRTPCTVQKPNILL